MYIYAYIYSGTDVYMVIKIGAVHIFDVIKVRWRLHQRRPLLLQTQQRAIFFVDMVHRFTCIYIDVYIQPAPY